jgi:hypothetical protein
MRARYYDSSTRRFLSRDPMPGAGIMTVNPYVYALNNPLTYGDALGLFPEVVDSTPMDPNGNWYYISPGVYPLDCQSCDSCGGSAREAIWWKRPSQKRSASPGRYWSGPPQSAGIEPDVYGMSLSVIWAGAEDTLEYAAKRCFRRGIESGFKPGSTKGAVTYARGSNVVGKIGTGVSGLYGGYQELELARSEGAGTAETVFRVGWSGAADAAISYAIPTPIVMADAAIGSPFSHSVKQPARIISAVAGGPKAERRYKRSVRSGKYGPLLKETNRCGEIYAKEGVGGVAKKFYVLFIK